jgi:ribosomal peptide maturation radical SAM protein 1
VTFPELVRRLAAGEPASDVPGVIARDTGQSRPTTAARPITDMDALPTPDYDDYFNSLAATPFAREVRPALLIESARGCWWGAKSHCTFCGLNGSTMAFRAKSAERVLAEIEHQQRRYGVSRFLAVDNILPHEYFKTLLPALKERHLGVSLFYEIKSNLKREQIELLRDAGVLALQPGVESLSTPVLRLMRKGVTGLQNVQLLRLCREYGIEIAWNLLYGFPGEAPQHYDDMATNLEALYHLKPPGAVSAIRLDRFSPNFDHSEDFGLSDVRPFALYNYLYPLPPERVANLAYFFEYRHADGREPERYVKPALERIAVWKANRAGDLVMECNGRPELALVDTRPGREPRRFHLTGLERELYELCDEIRARTALLAHVRDKVGADAQVEAGLDAFLSQMTAEGLMLREGDQFLSLAVPAGTPPVWDGDDAIVPH